MEAQFTTLRCFTLDGTDDTSHAEQVSMVRRDVACRNRHAQRMGRIIKRANVA
jgi:hypothetical protein